MTKQVAPQDVVGRDRLIAEMRKTLKRESAVFTAERRIGKTTVMKKMESEPMKGEVALYADLEKVGTPVRFVEVVLEQLKEYLTKRASLGRWFGAFLESIGGIEVGGVIKIPPQDKRGWQPILEKALANACGRHADLRFLFLWDEIPYMLQKINVMERASGSGEYSALAILDVLRSLRSAIPNLRMIFTGSVGLHHVLRNLRGDQLASEPTNEMEKIEIGPLAPEFASDLARTLLDRDGVRCDSVDSVVDVLTRSTDCVPFYIHRIAKKLSLHDGIVTSGVVKALVDSQLTSEADPWEMEHFRDRLKIYYGGRVPDADGGSVETASVARVLLSAIATAEGPQSIDRCNGYLKSRIRIEDRDTVVELLNLLAKDHYLVRDATGRYSFRYPLIRRWWILAEGLQ